MMLATQYLAENDPASAMEAMQNIYLAKHDAQPVFNAFRAYLDVQTEWERLIALVRKERYAVRAILERHNISAPEIHLDKEHRRKLSEADVLLILTKLPVLSDLTEKDRAILRDYCHVKTYYENETVFASGDHNDEVCLVLKGTIRLVANRENNSGAAPLEMATLGVGSFIGENCLTRNVFRLSGVATEFTELLCIGKTRLNDLLERHPAVGVKLLRKFLESMSDKITHTNEQLRRTADYDYDVVDGLPEYRD